MQPILKTTDYKNLYHFLLTLHEVTEEVSSPNAPSAVESVLIWSPEASSVLLDEIGKLEVVARHARQLNLRIVLSAASDITLRQWGQRLGWTVLWSIPGLDSIPYTAQDKFAPTSPKPIGSIAS